MYKQIQYFLNKKGKLDVAKAMLLSYFTYGNIFYGICRTKREVNCKNYRIVFLDLDINNPRDISTENLHSETNTLLLDKRRKYQLVVAMYNSREAEWKKRPGKWIW